MTSVISRQMCHHDKCAIMTSVPSWQACCYNRCAIMTCVPSGQVCHHNRCAITSVSSLRVCHYNDCSTIIAGVPLYQSTILAPDGMWNWMCLHMIVCCVYLWWGVYLYSCPFLIGFFILFVSVCVYPCEFGTLHVRVGEHTSMHMLAGPEGMLSCILLIVLCCSWLRQRLLWRL